VRQGGQAILEAAGVDWHYCLPAASAGHGAGAVFWRGAPTRGGHPSQPLAALEALISYMNKWEQAEHQAEEHTDKHWDGISAGTGCLVCVTQADGLPHTDWWPKDTRPDTYLFISLIGEGYESEDNCRSPIVEDDVNPLYSFCCELRVERPIEIQVEVHDYDMLVKDDSLGRCLVPPKEMASTWCDLSDQRHESHLVGGRIQIKVSHLLPPSPPLPPGTLLPPSPLSPPELPPRAPWVAEDLTSPLVYAMAAGSILVFVGLYYAARRCCCPKRRPDSFVRTLEMPQHNLFDPRSAGSSSSRSSDDAKIHMNLPGYDDKRGQYLAKHSSSA